MGLAAVPDCENHSLCQMGSQFASWSEAPPELHSTCDLRPFNPSFSHARAWYQGMDEAKDKGFLELRLRSHSVQNLYSSKHTHTCLAVYLKITGCGGLFRKASLSEHTFFYLLFHFIRLATLWLIRIGYLKLPLCLTAVTTICMTAPTSYCRHSLSFSSSSLVVVFNHDEKPVTALKTDRQASKQWVQIFTKWEGKVGNMVMARLALAPRRSNFVKRF